MTRASGASLLVLALAAGCAAGPDYTPPRIQAPAGWASGAATPESPGELAAFWDGFHDPVLSRLIQQALAGNLDLQIAGQRIRAAEDAVRLARSGGLPQVGLGLAAEARRQTQTLDIPPRSPRFGEYPFYSLGLNASWELDLFGETRRRTELAQAAAAGAVETQRYVAVGLSAAVASTYAAYRATEARLQIAQAGLRTAQRAQALVQRGFAVGDRAHLDVSQAEARTHAVEASLPPLEAQADDLLHALAILLGREPQGFGRADVGGSATVPRPTPLPASLPSEVIARRPDIRRAERSYAQANADVGQSIAALYPHFSIPLAYGPTTSSLNAAFRGASLLWRVGLNGSQALYAGGRLTAGVDAARARKDAALLDYRQAVLKAFAEVEDALTQQASERRRSDALGAQVADNRQALREAERRYGEGQVALLPLLDSQRELLASEDAEVTSQLADCLATISLYRSIGGGWQGVDLPRPRAQATSSRKADR